MHEVSSIAHGLIDRAELPAGDNHMKPHQSLLALPGLLILGSTAVGQWSIDQLSVPRGALAAASVGFSPRISPSTKSRLRSGSNAAGTRTVEVMS